MDKEFSSFRKAAFGGFNRSDVISYIEKMKNEAHEYKKQVDKTIADLNEKISQLESASALMEAALQENEARVSEEGASDLGQATQHLKAAADELYKSLGEFMQSLGQGNAADEGECQRKEELTAQAEVKQQAEDFVEDILASISYLDSPRELQEPPVKPQQEKESISEILSGYSFLK